MGNALPNPPLGFDDLDVDEQIDYVQALWDRIAAKEHAVPVPDWHRAIVEERIADHDADPDAVRPWTEVEAKAWYAREKEDLGDRFVREFSRTVERIGRFPDRFPEIAPGIRRALFQRFPYAAYYIRRQDVAVVVAVLHLHRRPGAWNERTSRETPG